MKQSIRILLPVICLSVLFLGIKTPSYAATLAPTILSPITTTTYFPTLPLNISLPQTALSGSVIVSLQDTTNGHTFILHVRDDPNSILDNINLTSPIDNSYVVSISGYGTQIPTGTYNITASFQDSLGEAPASSTVSNVTLSGTAPTTTPTSTPTPSITPTSTPTVTATPTSAPQQLNGTVTTIGSDKTIIGATTYTINQNNPTITGTGTPGSIIQVTIHSNPIIKTTTVQADGTWSIQFQNIPDGTHTILIQEMAANDPSNTLTLVNDKLDINYGLPATGESLIPLELIAVVGLLASLGGFYFISIRRK